MKKIGLFLIFIALSASLFGCSSNTKEHTSGPLEESNSPEVAEGIEAMALNNAINDFIIIDVREESEFYEGHINKALSIPLSDNFSNELGLDKSSKIVVYSNTDIRARRALAILKEAGFSNSQYLIGGIRGWLNMDLEAITPSSELLTRVAYEEVAREYLATDKLSLSLRAEAYDNKYAYLGLYNKEISYTLYNASSEVIKENKINTSYDGRASLVIELNELPLGSYRLELSLNALGYKNLKSYFSFDIRANINNEPIKSFDELRANGYFNEAILKNDLKYLENIYNKELSGYRLLDINGNEKEIGGLINNKPTILMLSSPSCSGCIKTLEYLAKLDLEDINLYYVVSFIDEADINSLKEELKKELEALGLPLDILLFDTVDYLADTALLFNSTPELFLLDNRARVVNAYRNSSGSLDTIDAFLSEFNLIMNNTYGITLAKLNTAINITIADGSNETIYTINRGESLGDITIPTKKGMRFTGFTINGELVDLNTYIFNEDTTVIANFKEIHKEMNDLDGLKHILIDLRGEDKFNSNHLAGAINIPKDSFISSFLEKKLEHDYVIILYGEKYNEEILAFLDSNDYDGYYLIDYDEPKAMELTYEERRVNGELDYYFDNRDTEREGLKSQYGENYLGLEFMDYNGSRVRLGDMLQHKGEPTIVMMGSTTCGICSYQYNEFLKLSKSFKYNFIEAIGFSSKENPNDIINKELSGLDEEGKANTLKYKVLDVNKQYHSKLIATELPIYYILDKDGNLTNLQSSLNKAIACVSSLNGTISVKEHSNKPEGIINMRLEDRINNSELKHIENNEVIYSMLKKSYSKFILKESYYDVFHSVRKLTDFINLNNGDFTRPTVLYVMNTMNSDFDSSLAYLDSISFDSLAYNFLIVMDNSLGYINELAKRPYVNRIMLDDYNTNAKADFTLYSESYFLILDSAGNITNAALSTTDLNEIMPSIYNTKSVKSPNKLTDASVINKGDKTLTLDKAIELGYLSHIDSSRDMARLDYLNVNFGRNYNSLEVINSNGEMVRLDSITDHTRPTIVCFIQSYQDDYYYNFNPLYELKDKVNIVIVFTNRRDEPYDNSFVDKMLKRAKEESIKKAYEPQNIDTIKNKVLALYPGISGAELDNRVSEYLNDIYDYERLRPYIYGSYAYLTTPLLDTEVRGIQLYLDRNGNLGNISQTYYTVGGVFKSVVAKLEDYIFVE